MRKQAINYFNIAFTADHEDIERELVEEMIFVWSKIDPAARRRPATFRKAILFGMNLQQGIDAGVIDYPEPKEKSKRNATTEAG